MRRNHLHFYIIYLFVFQNIAIGQSNILRPINIGERVPDFYFDSILNFKMNSAHISDFKGKLVILDFWGTNCAACIKAFPKLELLQKKFNERILILPVGFEYEHGDLIKFISARKGTPKEMRLPTTIQRKDDSLLMVQYPGQGVPREVWISGDGVLLGVTDGDAVTENNIQRILDGEILRFGASRQKTFANPASFLLNGLAKEAAVFGSAYCNYIDSFYISLPEVSHSDSLFHHLMGVNSTVFDYYKTAYTGIFKKYKIPNNAGINKRIIVESSSNTFYKDKWDARNLDNWMKEGFNRKNRFCYEVKWPKALSYDAFDERVIEDLDRVFELKSSIERKKTNVLELHIPAKLVEPSSNQARVVTDLKSGTDSLFSFSTLMLVSWLENMADTKNPIYGPSNLNGTINVVLPNATYFSNEKVNIDVIIKCLQSQGINITETQKELPFLILVDKRNKNTN